MNTQQPTVLVVISYYNARPMGPLVALLDAVAAKPAGCPFAVCVVVNRGAHKPLDLPERHRAVEVLYRENTGLNIGAWEHGWREHPGYDAYLFLQDECQLVREGWLAAFVGKAAEPNVGLVGECLSPVWDAPWEELEQRFRGSRLPDHFVDGKPADRLPCYRHFFQRHGILLGPKGDHLQSLILFARRQVLEAIGGFPVGRDTGEAIASEIAISKTVQAKGLTICQVGDEPFSYIQHPQWLHRRTEYQAKAPRTKPPTPANAAAQPAPARQVRRVALIFDNKARPETTGVYCRRALGQLVELEHFLPSERARIPREGFDLYLNIDDGLEYHLPADLRPSAWWAIDTHMNFDWCLKKARDFDFVFAAQKDGAERLRAEGIASATWLPLACDPELHAKQDVEKEWDVCFVGNVFPGPRAELLDLVRKRFPSTFVGQRYFEEMARTYSSSRIVFNRSIKNDLNMRVFEALASGSLLVTNDLGDNGKTELFGDGVHLATYRGAEELLDKLDFYLARAEVRERIAAAGRQEVLARHTYRHRMERLLEEIGSRLAQPQPPESARAAAPRAAPEGEHGQATVPRAGSANQPWAEGFGQDPSYFEFSRPEVVALVPPSARRVLDIGCGAGRLGEALKARQQAEVWGIEAVPEAARAAKGRLNHVLVADAEQVDRSYAAGYFDAIVCADVLEHLRDPARLLHHVHRWLATGGQLVASIPNVRHHTVVRGLLEGNWTYEPAGLLDRTHLRFFTRREIEKLFYRADFTINEIQAVPGPGYEEWERGGRRGEVRAGRLGIGGLDPAEAQQFYVYQYLIRAVPGSPVDFGLTSIVILTHNELAYTRQCVDSIRQYTDEQYELVFVDNGSTDGTADYLRGLPGAKVLLNQENRGFPAAANQGIGAASGQQVLLLNNDTLATTGWLRCLLQALHSDPRIGLAGPCSNLVSGEQQVPVAYEDLGGLDGFAWERSKAYDKQRTGTDRLVGFCLLIRREVIDRIGLLDERFGVGCFEDDDYCLRALKAGYHAVIAQDAFLHHFGGRTFIGSGVDFRALMEKNQELFRAKWEDAAGAAVPAQPAARPAAYKLAVARGGGLLLVQNQQDRGDRHNGAAGAGALAAQHSLPARAAPAGAGLRPGPAAHAGNRSSGQRVGTRDRIVLSCCIIARDNARTIRAALESIKPWVDEIIVVDTGSKDDTPQIAEQLGARVFHFPWRDDFSAARNESLKYARGEWIFWMDTDDTIDAENGRKLRELAYGEHDPAVLGYALEVHCPGPGEEGQLDVTGVDQVKLFRNRPDLRFDGRIHEQILGAIRRAGGEVVFADIFNVHSGYDHSPEGQKRKLERDLRILHLELQERPEHPFTLFNLGMTYADAKEFALAADFLRRSIRHSGPDESHLRKAYALLVYCLSLSDQPSAAWETCEEGLRLFPRDVELRFRQAILLHESGRSAEAVQVYERLLRPDNARHFSSRLKGLTSFKARHNLAVVYLESGDLPKAEEQWRLVVQEVPRYRPGWRGLGDLLLRQGKHEQVRQLSDQLQADPFLRCDGIVLSGQLSLAEGDLDAAGQQLERAADEYPQDLEALQAWGRFLFEQGDAERAEEALRKILTRDPEDAAAYHNLGTLYLRRGRFPDALQAYKDSLHRRPKCASTQLHLGYALKESGRMPEAAAAWRRALELAPGYPPALEALATAQQSP